MTKAIALSILPMVFSANLVLAEPVIGFGLNFTFGSGKPEVGIGLRAFTNDSKDEVAGSVGVDYFFESQSLRGSLGAAYMMDHSYIELNGGYNFSSGTFDFGLGAGGVNASTPKADAAPLDEAGGGTGGRGDSPQT